MTNTSRLFSCCCALLVTACSAGDDRLDPRDLELRDLLGVAPEVAGAWDRDQRAAARQVIDAGLHQPPAPPGRAALGAHGEFDQRIATALASVDGDRARHRAGALGVVDVAIGASGALATPHTAALQPHAAPAMDLQLRGWDNPGTSQLPARGMDVLAALASDAGHRGGPITVAAVPRLAVVAGYLPATASGPARLVVNPVVLAALEPHDPAAQAAQAPAIAASPARAASPVRAAASAAGNPYSFYGSVAECATAQRDRCDACLSGGPCPTITDAASGRAECTQLTANGGRGEFLICINLALSIDAVAGCAASRAPSCPRDTGASASLSSLEANAGFLDDPACGAPLDACLAALYGSSGGSFPGPGSGGPGSRPRSTSIDCGDSCSGDLNCDTAPDCELDGPSCDAPYDGTCADSNEQSGCSDTGGDGTDGGGDCSSSSDGGGGDCSSSSDGGGDCSSSDGGGGDCSGGDGGGDCGGGGGGGDCSGGGGGGDCSGGGGGDCGGGGGGDCNVGGRRGHPGAGLPVAIAWALLPIPFATIVRRRAERRRARAEYDAAPPDADSADADGVDVKPGAAP